MNKHLSNQYSSYHDLALWAILGALGFVLLLSLGCTTSSNCSHRHCNPGDCYYSDGINPTHNSQYSKIDSTQKPRSCANKNKQLCGSDQEYDRMDNLYHSRHVSDRNTIADQLSTSSPSIYITQGNEERFKRYYKVDKDGFPQSIGQGRVCVVFYGDKVTLAKLNRPSKTLTELQKYDVTLVSVTHNSNHDPELMAVVYDKNGNRSMTWHEYQGTQLLLNKVKQLE